MEKINLEGDKAISNSENKASAVFGGRVFGASSGSKTFATKSPMSALDKLVMPEAHYEKGLKEDETK